MKRFFKSLNRTLCILNTGFLVDAMRAQERALVLYLIGSILLSGLYGFWDEAR